MSRTIATILTLQDRMSGGIVRASRNVDGMSRQMRTATNRATRMANNFGKSAMRMGDKAVKFGAIGAAVVATIAAKKGFAEAFDMEGFKTQLETATKSTKKAGEIMAWSVKLANATPFETGNVIEMSAKYEAMGLSAKKWGGITADMAGATNKSVIQATEAIIDAQTGELERLKEFGLTKAMIAKKAGEMFKGQEIINKKGQIVDQKKFNKAMMKLMTEKYKGGAAKLAGTTKGMWSTVTGVTKTSLAKILGMQEDGTTKVGSLLDKVKKKLKIVTDHLQKWQSDGTITKIADKATESFNKIYGSIKKVMDFVKKHQETITNFAILFGSFYIAAKAVLTLKTAFMALKVTMLATNGAMAMSGIGIAIIAIGLLIAAGVLLWKNWDVVKVKLDTFVYGVKAGFSNMGTFVGNIFKGIANGFIDNINAMIELINKLPGVNVKLVDKYKMGTYKSLTKPIPTNTTRGTTQYASGTNYSSAGLALIHEKGGEIRKLSSGETIIPADRSKQLLDKKNGGNVFNIYFNGNVGDDEFFDRAGNRIIGQVKSELENM